MSDDKKLNLPAIKKHGPVGTPKQNRVQPLNLSQKLAVSKAINSPDKVQVEIARREQGLDLVLAGDLTTSMTEYHKLLKEKFSMLCEDLFPMVKNLKIGIVFYLDHDSGLPYLTRTHKLSQNITELQNFIKETPVLHSGNTTEDEAVEDAFHDIVGMNWREIGNRSVVLFGDARAHEPGACPNQHDYFDLAQRMYANKVIVNSVFCGEGNLSAEALQKLANIDVGDFSKRVSNLDHPNFFSWIANVTGGMIIGVEQIDDLIEIIKAAAAKDSGNLDEYEKSLKLRASAKLNLVNIAKQADRRRIASQKTDLLEKKP